MMNQNKVFLFLVLLVLGCSSSNGVRYLDKKSKEMAKRKEHQYGKITTDSLASYYYIKPQSKKEVVAKAEQRQEKASQRIHSLENRQIEGDSQGESQKTAKAEESAFKYIVPQKALTKARQPNGLETADSKKEKQAVSATKVESGKASYYSDKFQGNRTASGELYDRNKLTAAHRTFPFGTICKVTNLANGKSVNVKINDRGPFSKARVIDLSYKAMEILDGIKAGVIEVKVEVVE